MVLVPKLKIKAFEEEVKILLQSQPDHCLPLENFMTAYQRCFGHKCRIADYGFDKLVDLMGTMSHVAKVVGSYHKLMWPCIKTVT